jgi:hypothetical protein
MWPIKSTVPSSRWRRGGSFASRTRNIYRHQTEGAGAPLPYTLADLRAVVTEALAAGTCPYCGWGLNEANFSVDYHNPISRDGDFSIGNILGLYRSSHPPRPSWQTGAVSSWRPSPATSIGSADVRDVDRCQRRRVCAARNDAAERPPPDHRLRGKDGRNNVVGRHRLDREARAAATDRPDGRVHRAAR